jgi:hypothetical protein
MKVSIDSGAMIGLCEVQLSGCTAEDVPDPVTIVHTPHGTQINVCANCKEKRFKSGEWTK